MKPPVWSIPNVDMSQAQHGYNNNVDASCDL